MDAAWMLNGALRESAGAAKPIPQCPVSPTKPEGPDISALTRYKRGHQSDCVLQLRTPSKPAPAPPNEDEESFGASRQLRKEMSHPALVRAASMVLGGDFRTSMTKSDKLCDDVGEEGAHARRRGYSLLRRQPTSVQLLEGQVTNSELAPTNLRKNVGLLGYIHPMFHLEHGDTYAKYDNHNPQQHDQNIKNKKAAQQRRFTSVLKAAPVKLSVYAQQRKAEIQKSFAEGGSAKWASRQSQRSQARESWLTHNEAKGGEEALERVSSQRRRPSLVDAAQAHMWQVWREARSEVPLDVLREHKMWHGIEIEEPCLLEPDRVKSTQETGEGACHILQVHGFV